MFLIRDNAEFKILHLPDATPVLGDFIFIFEEGKIALAVENTLLRLEAALLSDKSQRFYCFGKIAEQQCLLVDRAEISGLNFTDARLSFKILSERHYQAVAFGNHLHHWRSRNKYCGICAAPMRDKLDERALVCSQCHHIVYPKISPCGMVLVTKGEQMLLARSPHFPPGMMSALAGFIEIGESAEQAIVREIREEVGIEVGKLQYICSQPWPFPDSLMLGFIAEYASGEITIAVDEIESAAWFDKNNLPRLPTEISLSRHLIEHFLKT